jgi:hypothetical protein
VVYKVENKLEPEFDSSLTRNEIWHALSGWAAEDAAWNQGLIDLVLRVNEEELENQKENASFEDFDDEGNFIPGKSLILCYRKKQVEKLSAIFGKRGIIHATYYGSAKSYEDANIIIGTFKKMGTGFDEALACSTFNGRRFRKLFLGYTLKDLLLIEQSVGRVFRVDNPQVYVWVGRHKICQNHWVIQERYFRASGAEIRDYHSADETDSEVAAPSESESSLSESESEVEVPKSLSKKEEKLKKTPGKKEDTDPEVELPASRKNK